MAESAWQGWEGLLALRAGAWGRRDGRELWGWRCAGGVGLGAGAGGGAGARARSRVAREPADVGASWRRGRAWPRGAPRPRRGRAGAGAASVCAAPRGPGRGAARGGRETRPPRGRRGGAARAPARPTATEARKGEKLSQRLTYVDIASDLDLSLNTIKTHLRHSYMKLGVTSRAAALKRAAALGVI